MKTAFLGAILVAVLAGYAAYRIREWVLRQRGLIAGWRWLTGHPLHGKHVTDAGWIRAGQKALTPTGHATRWAHLPRWKRAAWRTGTTLGFIGLLWAFFAEPLVTGVTMAA